VSIVIKTIGKKQYAYHAYRSGDRVLQRYLGNVTDRNVSATIKALKAENRVPQWLHPLFWDVDPATISIRGNARYVIERILETGSLEAFQWLQDVYPTRLIAETCSTSRKISEKSRNFWETWMGRNANAH